MGVSRPPSTKEALRRRLEAEIAAYLERGGQVQQIPRGVSGFRPEAAGGRRPLILPRRPATRTDLSALAAAIDRRKWERLKPVLARRRKGSRGRWTIVYDDFGEPIRRVWEKE
ncbi:MAG: hypothetical protein KatS3mg124_2490 [Porticoccaceae bacterium]|nr:MAG: hypothetical protein KatS3mg124_2490 [Porticoccaceae bacterium]